MYHHALYALLSLSLFFDAKSSVIVTKELLPDLEKNSCFSFSKSWHYTAPTFSLASEPEWISQVPGAYALSLKNTSVYGTHGVVLVGDKILQDSLWIWSPLYRAPHDIFPIPKAQKLKGTLATIALEGSSNYYHWMIEILPRIHLLKTSGFAFDFLYTCPLRYCFQKETLAALGIKKEQIIESTPATHLAPDRLIFPSQAARSCVTPQWVINFLKDTFLKDYIPKNSKKRIFVSRSHSSIRHIINEDEIFALVEPYGFKKVYLEKMSVTEQARLIHESEIIIGTHGAGMVNIVFATPGTVIIELFQEHLDSTFFELSTTMELQYHCVKTERIPELSQENVDIRYKNTFIEIEKLKRTLIPLLEKITHTPPSL